MKIRYIIQFDISGINTLPAYTKSLKVISAPRLKQVLKQSRKCIQYHDMKYKNQKYISVYHIGKSI